MKVEFKISGIDDVLSTLQSLPAEVVSRRGGPVKSALRKGALVIHKEAKIQLQAQVAAAKDTDQATSTGLLLNNLVVTRGKAPTSGRGERYLVRVRRKSYNRKGEAVTTLKTAQILEYGSEKQAPAPWIRPAFSAKAQAAIDTATKELVRGLDRIVKRLARGGAK